MTRVRETDLTLGDGRTLHLYDTGANGADALTVFWHHGTPNIGTPPEPLFGVSKELGVRWLSYDRPGYGGSSPQPGRDVASAALYVATVADALGIGCFAVMGHSGGGAHALACAALLPERVLAAVSVAGLAPYGAEGLDYFAEFWPSGARELRAAVAGREALEAELTADEFDPESFTPADHAALAGTWWWFNRVVGPALGNGLGPFLDDDLAAVRPWGFDPAQIRVPTLLLHGAQDRMVPAAHGAWLARRVPSAELRLYPDDGHISVLEHAEGALGWLRERGG